MSAKQPDIEKEWFEENLKALLQSLYNPAAVRGSPLAALIARRRGEAITVLRDAILDGIEALRPVQNTPRDSRTWRIYTILRRRYVEQVGQEIVARDMGLSVRQLQREEKVSRQVLAGYLWGQNGLDQKLEEIGRLMEKRDPTMQEPGIDTRSREIEWLRETAADEDTGVDLLVKDVLRTAAPILRMQRISILQSSGGTVHGGSARLPAVLIRQALLNVLAVLSKTYPGSTVCLEYALAAEDLRICIDCSPAEKTGETVCGREAFLRQYEDAVALLAIRGGEIHVEDGVGQESCRTTLIIPIRRLAPILVVDDNSDSLLLMERYLAGSPYRFYGVRDSREAVRAAEEIQPAGIILDVMMPERDGWELLGQLREHPATRHIPVLICTILAQRDLAVALGAADFLRKPVTRQSLLAALDHLLASQ